MPSALLDKMALSSKKPMLFLVNLPYLPKFSNFMMMLSTPAKISPPILSGTFSPTAAFVTKATSPVAFTASKILFKFEL